MKQSISLPRDFSMTDILEGPFSIVSLCPEVDEPFAGPQNGGADSDHEPLYAGKMARPLNGGVRGGDDLFGILVNGAPRLGQLDPVDWCAQTI